MNSKKKGHATMVHHLIWAEASGKYINYSIIHRKEEERIGNMERGCTAGEPEGAAKRVEGLLNVAYEAQFSMQHVVGREQK